MFGNNVHRISSTACEWRCFIGYAMTGYYAVDAQPAGCVVNAATSVQVAIVWNRLLSLCKRCCRSCPLDCNAVLLQLSPAVLLHQVCLKSWKKCFDLLQIGLISWTTRNCRIVDKSNNKKLRNVWLCHIHQRRLLCNKPLIPWHWYRFRFAFILYILSHIYILARRCGCERN